MENSTSADDVCFVVSPIGQKGSDTRTHADWVFKGIIEPVFTAYPNFRVERSDHISTPGQINSQVIDRLLNSRLVIADLSMLNPNVFYEIGIRHMVEKPIIHLQREDDHIPFDVAIYRSIKFSLKEYADIEAAQALLARMIGDVLKPDHVINNPVTEARGRVKLNESATPAQQIVLEDLAKIKSRLASLEIRQDLNEQMIDPTVAISSNNILRHNITRKLLQGDVGQFVVRNPPHFRNKSTVMVDISRSSIRHKEEIQRIISREVANYLNVSIANDDNIIEIVGFSDDMRSLYDSLRGQLIVGASNVTIIDG